MKLDLYPWTTTHILKYFDSAKNDQGVQKMIKKHKPVWIALQRFFNMLEMTNGTFFKFKIKEILMEWSNEWSARYSSARWSARYSRDKVESQ